MNKQDLIDFVATKTELTKKDITNAVDAVFEGIISGLKTSQEARFIGFGSFTVRHRPARQGRNPRTGDKIDIAATNQLIFKAEKELKEAVK